MLGTRLWTTCHGSDPGLSASLSYVKLLLCFQLLHSNLLLSMGYCILSQRVGVDRGMRRLTEARDRYCQLVLGEDYAELKTSQGYVGIACLY